MKYTHTNLILVILAISTGLLGLSIGLMGFHKNIELTTNFYGVTGSLPDNVYSAIAALSMLVVAMLSILSIKNNRHLPMLGCLLVIVSGIPLVALIDSSMWIESLGGFPAIGSGQGVIKYFALLSIGFLFLPYDLSIHTRKWLAIAPVLLVLLWIGGMKFTLLEAKGIEDLVASSPLMSWMYDIWDIQTTSNIIGVYDLAAVLLLIGAIYIPRLLTPALVVSGAVFIVTQTFLITWDGALSPGTLLSKTYGISLT